MTKPTLLFIAFLLILSPFKLIAQDFDELNNQAFKEKENKNYSKALELSTQSLNKKQNARAYIIRAVCRYYLMDYEAAIEDCTSALTFYSEYYTDDKEKSGIYFWRGLTYQELEKYEPAVSDFASALNYNYSEPAYAYWNRGLCYYNLKKYKESNDEYAKAIDKISDSKELSTLNKYRGDCYGKQGDYTKAYSFYERAISYNVDNYLAYWQKGFYKDQEDKYDESMTNYNKAINIILTTDPSLGHDLAILYRNKALIYKARVNYDSALIAINKSLQADPNYTNAYKSRAEIYAAQKKYDKARADYTNLISLEKDKEKISDLYLERSMIAMDILDYKSTLDDLNKAIEFAPGDGMNYWHRAILYGNKKNYQLGIKDCNTALSKYPDDSSSTSGLTKLRASLKDKAGDYSGAVDDYRASLKLYPNSTGTYYNLGRLFKTKMKNDDLGDANLEKAAELAQKYKDTTMYCYIKVFKGEKDEAIKTMLQQTEIAKTDKASYPSELHNMTCIYALAGNNIKALEYLDRSLAAGYNSYSHLVNDRDLESIMKLPQWKTILAKYKVPQPKW